MALEPHELEPGDRILWGDKSEPLEVVEAHGHHVEAVGPNGARYEVLDKRASPTSDRGPDDHFAGVIVRQVEGAFTGSLGEFYDLRRAEDT